MLHNLRNCLEALFAVCQQWLNDLSSLTYFIIVGLFSALEDYESDNSSTFAVDDGLSPLQRLENYIESENLFSRQVYRGVVCNFIP